jgi:hypothetical protein
MKGFFDFPYLIAGFRLALHEIFAWVDVFEWTAGFFTVAVNQPAASQSEDECPESALRLIARSYSIEFNESLLRKVFGIGAVTSRSVEEVN